MRAITLLLGLILLSPLAGTAQTLSTNNTRPLSLEECIASGIQKNIGLQISRVNVGIARSLVLNVYGYYDPVLDVRAGKSFSATETQISQETPVFGGESTADSVTSSLLGVLPWGMRYDLGADMDYFTRLSEDAVGRTYTANYDLDTGLILTQPLLRNFWIDSGRTAIKVNRAGLRIAELDLLTQLHTVVRDIQLNYYELIFALENVRVNEKAFELAQRLAMENKKRVEVGTMAPLEEKQAEAQAATARAELLGAMQQLGTQQRILVSLITDNYEQWQHTRIVPTENLIAVPQAYNLAASWISALTQRPDFNRLKQQVEQKGIEVTFRHNQLFPQLDLVGGYGRRGIDRHFSPSLEDIRDDNLPHYSFGLIFSFPLENRAARGNYAIAKQERDRLQLEMKNLHQTILLTVENAAGTAQSEFERVAATREARLASEAAYDAEIKKLENGKSTSFQVLSLQNDLTTARSQEIRALADYNRALTQLYFNEGTILERSRIALEK
jgi:outer membrane protein